MRKQELKTAGLDCLELSPEGETSHLPIVVGIHGRGSNAEDLAGLAPMLAEGYRFVFPNGPLKVDLGVWGTGYAWYGLGQHQAGDIAASRELLFGLVEALEAQHGVPRQQMVVLGFSQGAVMALELGLRSPEPFAGTVAMSGYLFAPETLGPSLRSALDRKVLLLHGTYDDVLSIDGARLARDVLEAAGLAPEYHEFPMGHHVSQESLAAVREFLERVLPPARSKRPAQPQQ
ncbi:MAG: hypothetical protein IT307_14195 [Chloroflexi bacterium]|nr:hypothetical protein [Chloroflexota bacterium]